MRESPRTMLGTEKLGLNSSRFASAAPISSSHTQHPSWHGRQQQSKARSKRILNNMTRRMNGNKWIITSIIAVLVLAIILILYFKMTHHR